MHINKPMSENTSVTVAIIAVVSGIAFILHGVTSCMSTEEKERLSFSLAEKQIQHTRELAEKQAMIDSGYEQVLEPSAYTLIWKKKNKTDVSK